MRENKKEKDERKKRRKKNKRQYIHCRRRRWWRRHRRRRRRRRGRWRGIKTTISLETLRRRWGRSNGLRGSRQFHFSHLGSFSPRRLKSLGRVFGIVSSPRLERGGREREREREMKRRERVRRR